MIKENYIISVENLNKTYVGGFQALNNVNLNIIKGEIFALLGPNGAGKTTLINIICGVVNLSSGRVLVDQFSTVDQFRNTRSLIGLVPQELSTDTFESVWTTIRFSRGLFGKAPDDRFLEKILKSLALWDKKDNIIMTLSGGMKRRVLIAKALAHNPKILFLDEPTAGVDVELRQDMWKIVHDLRQAGVTIILTTHYIEEAEQMADRIGIISQGKIILVREKDQLMRELGKKQLMLSLDKPLEQIPKSLASFDLETAADGKELIYQYNTQAAPTGITSLLDELARADIQFHDIRTTQSSLEDIFVDLVNESR